MKHVSSYTQNFTPLIKPKYTLFIKNGIMLLGFNDGKILPKQVSAKLISNIEKCYFCECTVLAKNSNLAAFKSFVDETIFLSENFDIIIDNKPLVDVRNISFRLIEKAFLECTFEVDCNLEVLENDVYFADPIIFKLANKLKLSNLHNINMTYQFVKTSNQLSSHDTKQFLEIGVPLYSLINRDRVSNGEVGFNEFHKALEKFLEQ